MRISTDHDLNSFLNMCFEHYGLKACKLAKHLEITPARLSRLLRGQESWKFTEGLEAAAFACAERAAFQSRHSSYPSANVVFSDAQ